MELCSGLRYTNGQLQYQSLYWDGELKEFTSWHSNGQMWVKEIYQDGKRDEKRKVWHDNGQLHELAFYRNGKLEGEVKSWHNNGYPIRKAFYRNGQLEGEHKYWLDDGRLWSRDFYRNGNVTFHLNGEYHFDDVTKLALLRIPKRLRISIIGSLNIPLISDLVKIVSQI